MTHAIIVANGPFLVKEIIVEAVKNKKIVALDGAANRLAQIGILPDIILGDFDSIPESGHTVWGLHRRFHDINTDDTAYMGNYGVTIVPAKDQSYTDLVKGIHYCDANHYETITIICATGGRLDHHQATMTALRTEFKKNRPIILHTEQQTICFMKDGSVTVKGFAGDKIGVTAYPKAEITSSGLLYEMAAYPLSIGETESIGNELTHTTAHITVSGDALLFLAPALRSQREFMKKNEFERHELQLRDAGRHLIEISEDDLATYLYYRRQFATSKSMLLGEDAIYVSRQNDMSIHGNIASKSLLSITPEKMQKLLLFQAHINEYNVDRAAGMDFDFPDEAERVV